MAPDGNVSYVSSTPYSLVMENSAVTISGIYNPPNALSSALSGIQLNSARLDTAAERIAKMDPDVAGNMVEMIRAEAAVGYNAAAARVALGAQDSILNILA